MTKVNVFEVMFLAVACGLTLLLVSAACVTAGVSAPGNEATLAPLNRDRSAVELPSGMDPMEVVRIVERNRGEVAQDLPRPERVQATGEVGSAFQVGRPGAVPGDQQNAAVASDGTNYLVVWIDARNGQGAWDICGARVSAEGVVLDSSGIAISTATNDQQNPAVAFDGTNYFVVWEDYRGGYDNEHIYGARVSPGGTVLDTAGIAISTTGYEPFGAAIAFDGTNYLVVWTDWGIDNDMDICGVRVSPGGTVLDPDGIVISAGEAWERDPDIAFDGVNYLVVWTDYRNSVDSDIYGARVSRSGTVLDPTGIAICTFTGGLGWQGYPAVAFDGTSYLVVWEDYRGIDNADIYGARVSTGGTILGLPRAICEATANQQNVEIAFDGTNYLVVWEDYRSGTGYQIYRARVSVGGTVLDPTGLPVATAANSQGRPAIAFDGENYLVVWQDYRSGGLDIYGARVSREGVVRDPSGIALSVEAVGSEYYPAVAFDGMNYFVVWADYRSGGDFDIYGARVSVVGSVLDPMGIPISTAANSQGRPAIAFDGENYLVVWQDYRSGDWDIYGARVSMEGAVLDPGEITISTVPLSYQQNPAVAFDGMNYLVVWGDDRGGSDEDVYGARVDVAGNVLDPSGMAISTATGDQFFPAIAFRCPNYIVVWQDYRSGSGWDIYGARVSSAGSVLDPSGIAISTATNHQRLPAVASGGTNYLVVWQDNRTGSDSDIYGARVSAAGSVLDPAGMAISTATNDQSYPAIGYDGTNYVVVWQDHRSGGSDIYGTRVYPAGVVLDCDGVAISNASGDQYYPCVDVGPGGQVLIAYGSLAAGGYSSYFIWGNLWGGYVGVEQEEAPALFRMCQSYPNPFNPVCTIRYDIAHAGKVSLRVLDVRGSVVCTLVSAWREPGVYRETWDGKSEDGTALPSGVYFCALKTRDYVTTHKMVLLK